MGNKRAVKYVISSSAVNASTKIVMCSVTNPKDMVVLHIAFFLISGGGKKDLHTFQGAGMGLSGAVDVNRNLHDAPSKRQPWTALKLFV